MKNIAVIEDEDSAADVIGSYIEKYAASNDAQFHVDRFALVGDFLDGYKPFYSVVFMDIQLPDGNGMDAATELRKRDKSVSIVFITNLVQYAQRGYEVDAVGFLVKPVSYYDFSLKFRKALDISVMNGDFNITINRAGGICRVSTDKLMYVEILTHRLYYHLVDELNEVTGTLSQVEKELKAFGFLRCNNCYLVNPRFVVNVRSSAVQVGNDTLQISRPRRAAFLAGLADWYAGKGVRE